MVTENEYFEAVKQHDATEKIISAYHKEQIEIFNTRMKSNPVFKDDELTYSAYNLCPCGHGLAYPKGCGWNHYWDCSAVLKGIADTAGEHCAQLPFSMTKIKSENSTLPGGVKKTSRGVFNPKIGWGG